tara:strand:- start:1035 stop:1265 length:231 start_codon:yes stop_codon:yes gene_type:complete
MAESEELRTLRLAVEAATHEAQIACYAAQATYRTFQVAQTGARRAKATVREARLAYMEAQRGVMAQLEAEEDVENS